MYRKKLAISQAIINKECAQIEAILANSDGAIYIVDNEHPFLWWAKWVWNLSDRDEIEDLLSDQIFPLFILGHYRAIITTLKKSWKITKMIPIVHVTSDASIPKCAKKRYYLEDLRQWLLKLLDKKI